MSQSAGYSYIQLLFENRFNNKFARFHCDVIASICCHLIYDIIIHIHTYFHNERFNSYISYILKATTKNARLDRYVYIVLFKYVMKINLV